MKLVVCVISQEKVLKMVCCVPSQTVSIIQCIVVQCCGTDCVVLLHCRLRLTLLMIMTLKSACRLPMLWHWHCSAVAWRWCRCWYVFHMQCVSLCTWTMLLLLLALLLWGLLYVRRSLHPPEKKGLPCKTTPDSTLSYFLVFLIIVLSAWIHLQLLIVLWLFVSLHVIGLMLNICYSYLKLLCVTEIKWPGKAGTETGKTTRRSGASRWEDESSTYCTGSRQRVTVICFEAMFSDWQLPGVIYNLKHQWWHEGLGLPRLRVTNAWPHLVQIAFCQWTLLS